MDIPLPQSWQIWHHHLRFLFQCILLTKMNWETQKALIMVKGAQTSNAGSSKVNWTLTDLLQSISNEEIVLVLVGVHPLLALLTYRKYLSASFRHHILEVYIYNFSMQTFRAMCQSLSLQMLKCILIVRFWPLCKPILMIFHRFELGLNVCWSNSA